ncbi:GlsB/YeaQ/YmgE family stress response membrane protein [Beijerinckia indica]|uniref:Transglycosylase-associated protein n=1 Tax=Beijerinckia indica subsp. indica (strain ATCC 9039 / DSM 1715 / NCIMB 8712) TaxID=395963 RepID=B2IHM0_BEII9|nr:GlsB/YeaQ/YmgE family stress response membrane protein [Beijerinckia indica]ACB94541.1 hypothetical protein Bind_0892 [Beijerinckia indica subsp. indica ATCC 9039]
MSVLGILWIIIIGFVAGMIARWIGPGEHKPSGFILTVALGIAGAFVATQLGQLVGWYRLDQGASFVGATVGAIIVLFIWGFIAKRLYGNGGTPPGEGPRRWL